jgi:dGTPase
LDAATKYPWLRRDGCRKFGVYAEDQAAFDWIRTSAPADRRCLEAQVMDWADDVAYSVHDVEDGVYGGHIRLAEVDDTARTQLVSVARELYTDVLASRLEPILDRLLALPALADLAGYDGSFAAQAAAKRATSELTGRFVGAAVRATRQRFGLDGLSRYTADLVIPENVATECALLKALAAHYVMRRPGTDERLAGQRRTLRELASALVESAPDGLGSVARAAGLPRPTTPDGSAQSWTRLPSSPIPPQSPGTRHYAGDRPSSVDTRLLSWRVASGTRTSPRSVTGRRSPTSLANGSLCGTPAGAT